MRVSPSPRGVAPFAAAAAAIDPAESSTLIGRDWRCRPPPPHPAAAAAAYAALIITTYYLVEWWCLLRWWLWRQRRRPDTDSEYVAPQPQPQQLYSLPALRLLMQSAAPEIDPIGNYARSLGEWRAWDFFASFVRHGRPWICLC